MSEDEPSDSPDSNKTYALGHLARGIAHDFNNYLAAIQGNAQMLLREDVSPRAQETVERIMFSAKRASELVEQIHAYIRDGALPIEPIDLVQTVRDAVYVLESRVPKNVDLVLELPEQMIPIRGNASQIAQIVMNLGTNGVQALDGKGGHLSIAVSDEGEEALLSISDDGSGIPQEIFSRIFDPFFTTKSYGLGLGLGLAVVRTAIENHQGRVDIASEANLGTRFDIRLHKTDEPLPETASVAPKAVESSRKKKLNVLLAEDEATMRGLGVDVLHTIGCRVSSAEDGQQAFEIFKRRPEYFDVIVSDSKMPRMTGPELLKAAREIRPEIPFILVTAFNNRETEGVLRDAGNCQLIRKPFLIENLQRALQEAFRGEAEEKS